MEVAEKVVGIVCVPRT